VASASADAQHVYKHVAHLYRARSSAGEYTLARYTIEAKTLNKKSNKLLQLVHRGNRWPKKLVFTDFVLSDTFPNNVFLSNSFDAFVCVDIAIKNGITQIIAHKFLELVNAFTYPYISSRFHIFSGSNLSSVTFPMRPSDVFCKVFAIPLNPSPQYLLKISSSFGI
jgi:hypothetical protein